MASTLFWETLRGARRLFLLLMKRKTLYDRTILPWLESSIYFAHSSEQGIRLLSTNGVFATVLPDMSLLKDYPETRLHILDHLTITKIDWWGMAFESAIIDSTTIVGVKKQQKYDSAIDVAVHDPEKPLQHSILQNDFRANPRYTFNLFLAGEKRTEIAKFATGPFVREYFEVHEGVHSGNIRQETLRGIRRGFQLSEVAVWA